MSTGTSELTTAGAGSGLDFDEMELTLGLPGDSREKKRGTKRRFSEIDLKLATSETPDSDCECSDYESRTSPSKERVIGWPPVRSNRRNFTMNSNCKYVKVAVDGAPYLRKVDLKSCASYQQLLRVFEDLFSCFTIQNVLNEKKLMDNGSRSEYIPTYEDRDGDWMLVGDVPWKMFVESCRRIRLMKSSEAITQVA